MLERNKATWNSIVKSKICLSTIAISLLCGSAQAQWTLVDNFETHTAGNPIESVVGPGATWTGGGEGVHTAEADPSDATNMAMQVSGAPGSGILRAELGASDVISAGDTGTVFYRFRTPVAATGQTDHVLGLTDNNLITNFNFKSGLRNTVPAGANNMDARDAGIYESVGTLADNTWYKLWMVTTNTNPGTFELYLQSDSDANFATQTKLASASPDAFDYRVNGDTDIINVYFRNANNAGGVDGNGLYFDDLYINSSAEDLTDPLASTGPLLGDFTGDGVVDCADLDGYVGNIGAAATGELAALDFDNSGTLETTDADSVIGTLVVAGGIAGTFPGDLNCDGTVNVLGDAFPLVASLNSAVTTYAQGDLNFDGFVNVLGDAFVLVANLGNSNQ